MKKPVAKAAKAMMKAKPDVVIAIPPKGKGAPMGAKGESAPMGAKGKGAAAKAKTKTPSKRGY
jgi:hypothetical protein